MAQKVIDSEKIVYSVRTAINENFNELYSEVAKIKPSNIINAKYPPIPLIGMVGGGKDSTVGWNSLMGHATSNPGTVIEIPKDDYKMSTINSANIPINTTVRGLDKPRLFTQATALYNVWISQRDNTIIDGIIFDQWGDIAQTPTNIPSPMGCHIIHAPNVNVGEIRNCEFYGYGITCVLTQPQSLLSGGEYNLINCKGYWKRTTDVVYDVSVFNIESRKGKIINNSFETIKVNGIVNWKPETAFEIHISDGEIAGNTVYGARVGILPIVWPKAYEGVYDPTYYGGLMIHHNRMRKVSNGIVVWGAHSEVAGGIDTRNINIHDNYINLHLVGADSTAYHPASGIWFTNGGYTGQINNCQIKDNEIEFTWDGVGDVNTIMNLLTLSDYRGAINLANNHGCNNFEISGNSYINFPHAIYNLRALSAATHKNINIHDELIVGNSGYVYPSATWNGLINVDKVNGLKMKNVIINYTTKSPIELIHFGDTMTDIIINDISIPTYTNGYLIGYNNLTVLQNNVVSDIPQILSLGGQKQKINDRYSITNAQPDGPYAINDVVWYIGSTSISKRGWRCTTAGAKRTTSAVLGTFRSWAPKEMYVSRVDQFKLGEVINVPDGTQKRIVGIGADYLLFETNTTTWSGNLAVTLVTPVFADII